MKMVFIVGAIQMILDTLRGSGSHELSSIMFEREILGLGCFIYKINACKSLKQLLKKLKIHTEKRGIQKV